MQGRKRDEKDQKRVAKMVNVQKEEQEGRRRWKWRRTGNVEMEMEWSTCNPAKPPPTLCVCVCVVCFTAEQPHKTHTHGKEEKKVAAGKPVSELHALPFVLFFCFLS